MRWNADNLLVANKWRYHVFGQFLRNQFLAAVLMEWQFACS
jgi:hypothetical protein